LNLELVAQSSPSPDDIPQFFAKEFVGGDTAIAEAMAQQGELLEFPKGFKIITEGGEGEVLHIRCLS
jgi:hypothetical protein